MVITLTKQNNLDGFLNISINVQIMNDLKSNEELSFFSHVDLIREH